MSRVREISIKNRTYYLFNDIINFKNLDPNNFKIDKKSHKNILIYYIGYVAPNSFKPLYLIINNTNGYIGESNELMMMMNCYCGMVDRRKAFSLISSRDHCQRSSPSRISDTPRAGFKPAQNLSSGFVE